MNKQKENKYYPDECPECHTRREFFRTYGRMATPWEMGIDKFGGSCRCEEIHQRKGRTWKATKEEIKTHHEDEYMAGVL